MSDWSLPDGFRFGVATAAFQIEGGINGPGEPANNWARWERTGKVEPSGVAVDFWNTYEEHLDRAAGIGLNSFRLGIEWARCEPEEGRFDAAAFDRYEAILSACREHGLEPLVTLHHFTHPAWLGEDFWLDLASPQRYAEWASVAVARLQDHCRAWITINEPNVLALQTWVTGIFPPGRLASIPSTIRATDHLLTGHVLAYAAIKELQPDSVVSINPYSLSIYELDRLQTDLLSARAHGIGRNDVHDWLVERRDVVTQAIPHRGRGEKALRWFAGQSLPLDLALPRTLAAVYQSAHERTLDVTQIDYYDAAVSRKFRLPGHRTAGGRNWMPGRMLWDDHVEPRHLVDYARLGVEDGLDLWIVENGLCNRVAGGRGYQRGDNWNRVAYLRENLASVVDAIDAGIPITGYWHWTLTDNYEWGSYEPRFGLFGVDRRKGCDVLPLDSMGDDAAGAYRQMIGGLREGDRSVVGR